jgi:hypothetical protein
VTFDELFHRARCIVENLSSKVVQPTQAHPKSAPEASDADLDDDVPF